MISIYPSYLTTFLHVPLSCRAFLFFVLFFVFFLFFLVFVLFVLVFVLFLFLFLFPSGAFRAVLFERI
jgi:hypothetical protein